MWCALNRSHKEAITPLLFMLLANKTNIIQSKKRRDFLRYQSWAIYIVYNISMKGQLINKLKLQMEHWNNYKWQITIKKGALNIVNYKCFFFHERAVVTNLPMEWLQMITTRTSNITNNKFQKELHIYFAFMFVPPQKSR